MTRRFRSIAGRKAPWLGLAFLIFVIPALVSLQHWSTAPAETTVHVANSYKTAAVRTPSFQPLQTRSFVTEVPEGWRTQTHSDTPVLTQLMSIAPPGANGQAAFTSGALPPEGLTGLSDFMLRSKTAQSYTHVDDPQLTHAAYVFYDSNSGPAYTAFLSHGFIYAEVSVSTTGSQPAAHDLLQRVLEHWQWLR